MKIKNLTRELYEQFEGEPPPVTVRGIALTEGDDVIGMVAMSRIEGKDFIMCGLSPEAKKRSVIQGWGVFKEMMDSSVTYFALIDEDLKTAPGFLKHFGFNHYIDDIYIYKG